MIYVDVIVPLAVEGVFTYAVPLDLQSNELVGRLVLVPFIGNKRYTAIVLSTHSNKPKDYEVKEIDELADEQLLFSDIHLKFLIWISTYYMASFGEVMKAMLPAIFRLESVMAFARNNVDIDFSILNVKERAVLNFLKEDEYVEMSDIEKALKLKGLNMTIKHLLASNYIVIKEKVDELFKPKREYIVSFVRDFSDIELSGILDELKRATTQQKLLEYFIGASCTIIEKSKLLKDSNVSSATLRALCDKGIFKIEERVLSRLEFGASDEIQPMKILGEQQLNAKQEIDAMFLTRNTVLLHGVTSSGKTEVYIHLMRDYIDKSKQVLYMLPEIALTVQIVKRLQRVFGRDVGVYHSGMSDQMRAELWHKQCSEQPYKIILGVRSSVFLPFYDLGLIIVDEEHDASYKQKEPAPRYNARDSAIMLARLCKAKVLLGSATPSFESYQNAISGKYGLVQMFNRYGGVELPELVMVDLKEYRRKKLMKGSFSPVLLDNMAQTLNSGKQIIIFQNKRGYSSYLQCSGCSSIPKCKKCDVSMTYYKQKDLLICRYCGAIERSTKTCSDCGSVYQERVPGTEKIEEEVSTYFPSARVARMDTDTMRDKAKFRNLLEDFEHGRLDVLVGTQMLTKGLDFDNVSLVGIMDADSMLSFPDFRAEERAYSMLLQVSGRAGRRGERGRVLIQAGDVKNRVYEALLHSDYTSFFHSLSEERKLFMYPPFSRVIQIELRHKDVAVVRNAANDLAAILRPRLASRVCGPAVPDVGRINNQYRVVINLKLDAQLNLVAIKKNLKDEITRLKSDVRYKALRVFCDVDS